MALDAPPAERRTGLPPHPRGLPLLGNSIGVGLDRLGSMARLARDYGDAACFRMGPKVMYMFNHPDQAKYVLHDNAANYHKGIGLVHAKRALGEGLLTSDGELWKGQRKAIAPAFSRERINNATDDIITEAGVLVDRWRDADPGVPVDVVEEMTSFTLAVLGRLLLGGALGPTEMIGDAFGTIQDQAMFEMSTLNMVPPWLPLPRNFRFRKAKGELEHLVNGMIDERVGRSSVGSADNESTVDGDIIVRLLRMYGGGTGSPDPVTRRRLRDELVTLLLAGHETTSSTLGWTWYLMDQHPDVAARVRDEARAVLGDRTPTFEDLHGLAYTHMVVEEALRLYPPVWVLPRRAVEADEIAGYPIKAGSDVLISPYAMHRNPEFWADPERFDPDRHTPERARGRRRYSYIPFGGGPRVCVGSNLGMAEAVIVTAMVARELDLRLQPGREVTGEAMLSLRIKGGLPMTIHQV
jgi:enediyne biosynthesis protein E7